MLSFLPQDPPQNLLQTRKNGQSSQEILQKHIIIDIFKKKLAITQLNESSC